MFLHFGHLFIGPDHWWIALFPTILRFDGIMTRGGPFELLQHNFKVIKMFFDTPVCHVIVIYSEGSPNLPFHGRRHEGVFAGF